MGMGDNYDYGEVDRYVRTMNFWEKVYRRITHFRLTPIRVYCLHHVTDMYNSEVMQPCDWLSMVDFKQQIDTMKANRVNFISLGEAYSKIAHDSVRRNHYAVLTFDDGYESLNEVLPWLFAEKIPCTLFLNPGYMNGTQYRECSSERYLTMNDIDSLIHESKGLLTIGMHGWEHWDATQQASDEFEFSVSASIQQLSRTSGYVPFWAYAWGRHNETTDSILNQNSLIPVLIDGGKNYNDATCVHRELLQG